MTAGLPTRAERPVTAKQFLSIGGIPVLVHCVRAFLAVTRVKEVLVAVRKAETGRVTALLARYGFLGRVRVVEGGDNRQESVSNALDTLRCDNDDIVLVHDAVRPLIEGATIERTIDAIERHGAAMVAMPAVDTIKQVERTAEGALVSSTVPRERVVHAQTPQGARYNLLRRAFDEAAADEFQGTDESSLLERAGIDVWVVPGSSRNFKITQAGDLELADYYLSRDKVPVLVPELPQLTKVEQ